MKIDIFNAEEKYDILYTDPPWKQGRGGKKAARITQALPEAGMCLPNDRIIIPRSRETGTLRKNGA
jgi:16S rRNA G966 N2-methylase RsmD